MERELSQFEEIVDRVEVDLGFDPQAAIQSQIDADRHLFGIQAVQRKIDREKAFLDEAMAFYNNRIAQLEKQKEFLEGKVENFLYALESQGTEPKAATPSGTAYLRTSQSKLWDDVDLVKFARFHKLDSLVKVKESVSKPELAKKCEELEIKPPYTVEEKRSLVIRPKKS